MKPKTYQKQDPTSEYLRFLEEDYKVIFNMLVTSTVPDIARPLKQWKLDMNSRVLLESTPYCPNSTRKSSYGLEDYFLDIKNPTEEELTMFELDAEVSRYIYLLLLSIADKTKKDTNWLWLKKVESNYEV